MGDRIQEEMIVGRIQTHIHILSIEKVLSLGPCKKCMKCLMNSSHKADCIDCILMFDYQDNILDCIHKQKD